MLDIIGIYNKHLENKRKEYREKNPKNNNLYRPSSSGMCARKIYFESIEKAEPTDNPNDKSRRLLRLGEIVHQELQEALIKEFQGD